MTAEAIAKALGGIHNTTNPASPRWRQAVSLLAQTPPLS